MPIAPLGSAWHGAHQSSADSRDARRRAIDRRRGRQPRLRNAPRRTRASGRFPHAMASYEALLRDATTSTRSTSRCPTRCTSNGRCARSTRASTCCARSRSRISAEDVDRIAAVAARARARRRRRRSCIGTSRSSRAVARAGARRRRRRGPYDRLAASPTPRAERQRRAPRSGARRRQLVGRRLLRGEHACLLTGRDRS